MSDTYFGKGSSDTAQLEMRIHRSNDKISDLKHQLKEVRKDVLKLNKKVNDLLFITSLFDKKVDDLLVTLPDGYRPDETE